MRKVAVQSWGCIVLFSALCLGIAPSVPAQTQEPELKPAVIEQPMSDFTLPRYQGGEWTLSGLKGKNIIIIVPRVWADTGYYCTICDYQYLDFADMEKTQQFQKAVNAEIVFLFPFGRDDVAKWLASLPEQMDKIKAAKYPPDPSKLDDKARARMERWGQFFPKDFSLKPGEAPTPFPILLDADRKIAKRLGVFATEWSGTKVDQGIPSVFIVDSQGVLMFKYIGQNTVDRPSPAYLAKILGMINAARPRS
jgi:peroxiredoxin